MLLAVCSVICSAFMRAQTRQEMIYPIVSAVNIRGNNAVSEEALRHLIETSPGSPLLQSIAERDVQAMLTYYTGLGFAFTEIRIALTLNDATDIPTCVVLFTIDEGPRVLVREVSVQGNAFTSPDVIAREARLRPDEVFSQSKLDRMKRRLERLQLFTSVGEPQLYLLNDSTLGRNIRNGGILCTVQEGNMTAFDGVLGYVPGRTATESGYLTGLVSLTMKNLFGTGRKVAARWQRETAATQELDLRYIEPWIFGMPIDVSLGYFQRKQDSTYVKSILSGRADYNITDELSLGATISSESIYPSTSLGYFTVFESSSLMLGGEIRYDTRDNSRVPTTGVRYVTSYQSGRKNITGPVEYLLPTDTRNYYVQRVSVDIDLYTMPWRRHVFALGGHGRQVTSSVLEISDMYQFGGSSTVRGYRENQFIGSRIGWASFEYRFLTGRLSHVFTFVDGGYFSRPDETNAGIAKQERFLYGYGVGARLETGLGILSVSYALGKGDAFSAGKIHFGIINEF
ncbi:MAG TPA: BamA/TamA family outer membrane protein [Bacteroidota bacterium]|nr:BamA/TamA family outer membrane protein [Bacteroidota bacterium]